MVKYSRDFVFYVNGTCTSSITIYMKHLWPIYAFCIATYAPSCHSPPLQCLINVHKIDKGCFVVLDLKKCTVIQSFISSKHLMRIHKKDATVGHVLARSGRAELITDPCWWEDVCRQPLDTHRPNIGIIMNTKPTTQVTRNLGIQLHIWYCWVECWRCRLCS